MESQVPDSLSSDANTDGATSTGVITGGGLDAAGGLGGANAPTAILMAPTNNTNDQMNEFIMLYCAVVLRAITHDTFKLKRQT